MEIFCSSTVELHLLLYYLDWASMLHIVEVDDISWMQRDRLLDIPNVWLWYETCFDAVATLRDPWHSVTPSPTGHSICLVNNLH